MRCDQCQMLSINGHACHETGCPNSGKTWDADRETWVKYVECFECGSDVEQGTQCDCQDTEYLGELDDTDEDSEGSDFIEDWE